MSYVKKKYFGTTRKGEKVYKFTILNNNGLKVDVINYGATIVAFKIPDKSKKMADIVLGYDNLEDYEKDNIYLGSTIGRNANRISKASFELNNIKYILDNNEGENHIHGGKEGFHKKVWDFEITEQGIYLTYVSKDMEEGYPGECILNVEFILNDENELMINYTGTTTDDTILNPTNHSYFNLDGHDSGDILDHKLLINSDYYTPIKEDGLPIGKLCKVSDTPLDLRRLKLIRDIVSSKDMQIILGKGLDHNFSINGDEGILRFAGQLESIKAKKRLLVYSTLPGIQVYTGNNIVDKRGKGKAIYKKHAGICLETQFYPDSINIENFTAPILRKGDLYKSTTVYRIESID